VPLLRNDLRIELGEMPTRSCFSKNFEVILLNARVTNDVARSLSQLSLLIYDALRLL
jgi:hypothetical protein